MLMISIVDNSEKDIAHLRTLLDAYFQRSGTAYTIHTYSSGMEFVRSTENSSIVFMDIQMNRLDGLETARIMRKLGSTAQLIYVTRAAELAIKGYEVDALDFILKPATQSAIDFALDKAMKRIDNSGGVSLVLKFANGAASLPSNEIIYVEVFDHNLVYHTIKGDHNVRGRLSDVYEKLDKEQFILCNRSFIVNLRFVTGIRSDHVMVGDMKIAVSKSHRKEIMERFSGNMNK